MPFKKVSSNSHIVLEKQIIYRILYVSLLMQAEKLKHWWSRYMQGISEKFFIKMKS